MKIWLQKSNLRQQNKSVNRDAIYIKHSYVDVEFNSIDRQTYNLFAKLDSKKMTQENTPTGQLREKWGAALNGGFVVIPTTLLRHQKKLKLDCESIVIISNLLASWWEVDKLPYLRTETIALRTGLAQRTVQRRLQNLEKMGLLKREWQLKISSDKHAVAQYDMRKLVAKLDALGKEDRAQMPATETQKNLLLELSRPGGIESNLPF